jgi:hypothetical protein
MFLFELLYNKENYTIKKGYIMGSKNNGRGLNPSTSFLDDIQSYIDVIDTFFAGGDNGGKKYHTIRPSTNKALATVKREPVQDNNTYSMYDFYSCDNDIEQDFSGINGSKVSDFDYLNTGSRDPLGDIMRGDNLDDGWKNAKPGKQEPSVKPKIVIENIKKKPPGNSKPKTVAKRITKVTPNKVQQIKIRPKTKKNSGLTRTNVFNIMDLDKNLDGYGIEW